MRDGGFEWSVSGTDTQNFTMFRLRCYCFCWPFTCTKVTYTQRARRSHSLRSIELILLYPARKTAEAHMQVKLRRPLRTTLESSRMMWMLWLVNVYPALHYSRFVSLAQSCSVRQQYIDPLNLLLSYAELIKYLNFLHYKYSILLYIGYLNDGDVALLYACSYPHCTLSLPAQAFFRHAPVLK